MTKTSWRVSAQAKGSQLAGCPQEGALFPGGLGPVLPPHPQKLVPHYLAPPARPPSTVQRLPQTLSSARILRLLLLPCFYPKAQGDSPTG